MFLYHAGDYAWPAANFFIYCIGYAVIVLSSIAVYAILKDVNKGH